MEFFINLFNLILYKPLFNILILFYQYLPGQDFGIAIILLTILIRILFYPLGIKAIKSQKVLQELQPKIREIQKKYKDNKEKQTRAMMELYQKEKINPFSGCLPLLIQLPILIALYQVFRKGLVPGEMINLYYFVPKPGQINPTFLGIMNLGQPSLILAILAGIFQFIQTKMITPKVQEIKMEDRIGQFSKILQKQTLYVFPIFTFFILLKLPSAIGLYWIVTTTFSIIQQYFIFRKPALATEPADK
ncbi:membrane protein insertase YidC [Patescibacteria group bacterium]|nr:membrane protein insertase YidC [Patescibacteria group bacterium]